MDTGHGLQGHWKGGGLCSLFWKWLPNPWVPVGPANPTLNSVFAEGLGGSQERSPSQALAAPQHWRPQGTPGATGGPDTWHLILLGATAPEQASDMKPSSQMTMNLQYGHQLWFRGSDVQLGPWATVKVQAALPPLQGRQCLAFPSFWRPLSLHSPSLTRRRPLFPWHIRGLPAHFLLQRPRGHVRSPWGQDRLSS